MLIIYNLYQSSLSRALSQTSSNQPVQTVASQGDINWYQDKRVIKMDVKKVNVKKANVASENNEDKTQTAQKEPAIKGQTESLEARQDVLKAMSAPISSNQLIAEKEARSPDFPNNMPLTPNGLNQTDTDQNMQGEKLGFLHGHHQQEEDYLGSALKNPLSPYELQAGTIIPGILLTGINSDLPGQITGQVRSNVYDSISGRYLLIPQGSKLTGLYDSQIAYGQERVLVVWKRIIFPNGQSINLEGMPGIDLSGYAGFNDQVNNHYGKIFGSVLLMSVLGAGAQLAQPQNNTNPFAPPTVGQTIAQSLGTNIANTGTMITAKNINIQPTLEIRPGYEFNISVTKDMVFTGPYRNE
jgi:type IV secretion system protein VirB10